MGEGRFDKLVATVAESQNRRGVLKKLGTGFGAVLASLADTLMPDAYREGGKPVAFATAAGFFVSFVISEL